MKNFKNIAVVCNYELKSDRIGGMDRFFKAYNQHLLQMGHQLNWFFSGGQKFDFYSEFDLHIAQGEPLESLFLKSHKNFDVVVTHFLELCTSFYKALKENNQSFVIAVDHNPRPINGFPFKKRVKNKIKGILYGPYIDCFVGVSNYTKDCILQDFGYHLAKKTKMVYNGIDTSAYRKRTEQNFGKFIVASHLRKSKGIQDLIEAVKMLPSTCRQQIVIDVYGEGPLEDFLKQKVEESGLSKVFFFHGSSPALPQELYQYCFMLQPTYMECFSLSILESLAANVPVITTSVGGNPEIIRNGDNGFLYKAGDIAALAELLEKVLKDELSIEQGVSRKIEENFNLDQMLEGHLKLLPCI